MESYKEAYAAIRPIMETGDYATAIKHMENLVANHPHSGQGHYDLGALVFAAGNRKRAFEHYREAVLLEPHNTTFLKGLADYYYAENNDIEEARNLYCRVIDREPHNVETLQILGNLAVVERDFKTAMDFYSRVLDIEPWNHDALIIVEKLEQKMMRHANEKGDASEYEHSQCLVQAGKVDEAIDALEALIKAQPDHATAYNDLGVLYYQTGQKEKTLRCYEEAVRLRPNELNFQKNIADFYVLELGRVEEALEIYCRVLSEAPTDIETLMAVGIISKALHRNDDAMVFFGRVLDLEPWNAEANQLFNELNPMQIDII